MDLRGTRIALKAAGDKICAKCSKLGAIEG